MIIGKMSPATYSKLGMLVLMALERLAREDAEAAAAAELAKLEAEAE